jgi:transposase InsO family protein
MAWKQTNVTMERAKFITEYEKGCWLMTELCAAFGISRKTGYKYLERYEEAGLEGLKDRLRAPHRHPNRTPQEVERRILRLRGRFPRWGSKKILAWLGSHEPELALPVRSTTDEILKRHGLVEPRRRRRRATPSARPLIEADAPNRVWPVDFKGHFRVGDGQRCDPLTITDGCSRYALECKALTLPKLEDVQECFVRVFCKFGLPDFILSDNGPPFASTGIGGLTRLSVWFVRLGVQPMRIEPGRPEQNGRHERFHLTLKQETADPPSQTIRSQQRAFTRFRRSYNEERPHEALDMRTPAELYVPSSRPYPRVLPDLEYPSGVEVRRVRKNGSIKWCGHSVFLGEALRGQDVSLEHVGDGTFEIHFGMLPLGSFHESSGVVLPTPRDAQQSCS